MTVRVLCIDCQDNLILAGKCVKAIKEKYGDEPVSRENNLLVQFESNPPQLYSVWQSRKQVTVRRVK